MGKIFEALLNDPTARDGAELEAIAMEQIEFVSWE